MDENLIKLKHLRQAATQANGRISEVATTAAEAIEEVATAKQDKLSGLPGQVVGFDEDGNAVPQAAPSGGDTVILNAPRGSIMAWSGTEADIPDGWHICNGEDGTPDFRDKFLLGAGPDHELGSEGGESKVALTVTEMPAHSHSFSIKSTSGNTAFDILQESVETSQYTNYRTNSTGGSQPHNNMPPYYAILWIMKMTEPVSTGNVYAVKAPVGTIVWWSGSADNIPIGWHICDGTGGTKDLRGKFILAASEDYPVYSEGGEAEVKLTINEMPSHGHVLPISGGSTLGKAPLYDTNGYYSAGTLNQQAIVNPIGNSKPHNNMPPYYSLCAIQKIAPDESDGVTTEQLNEAISSAIGDIDAVLDAINGKVI